MKIKVEMTRKQRTKSKMCIVLVCMRYVKKFGCHYNQSGVLKIELLILLRLARFKKLGAPPILYAKRRQ